MKQQQQQLTNAATGEAFKEVQHIQMPVESHLKIHLNQQPQVWGPAFSIHTKISRQEDENVFLLSPLSPTLDTR